MSTHRDITTVLLDYRQNNRILRPFYCCKCGKCVCEIIGNVQMLVPGTVELVDISSISNAVNCYGFIRLSNGKNIKCDAKYIF